MTTAIRILTEAKYANRVHSEEGFLAGKCTFHVYTVVISKSGKRVPSYNPSNAATAEQAVEQITSLIREVSPRSSTIELFGVAPIAR